VRTGIAATAPLDATGARVDATTPTAPSALQEIAAMMVDGRTLGVRERRATENGRHGVVQKRHGNGESAVE
jgi:transposase